MTYKVEIYQTRYEEVAFRNFCFVKKYFNGLKTKEALELLNYQKVYQNDDFKVLHEVKDDNDLLEFIFRLFNDSDYDYYKNKNMRSLSVSDIVKINNKYYYCDDIGFQLLKKLKIKKEIVENE